MKNSFTMNYTATLPEQSTRTIRYALNRAVVNKCKTDPEFEALAAGFQDTQGTIEDVAAQIKQGWAICTSLTRGKRRKIPNFAGSEWIPIDVDNCVTKNGEKRYHHQLTLEEALQHPFIQKHCWLMYTTPSHTEKWHRFRLIFLLPEFCSDIEVFKQWIKLVLAKIPHDPTTTSVVNAFYGNTEAEFWVNDKACLPAEWASIAAERAEESKKQTYAIERDIKKKGLSKTFVDRGWNEKNEVLKALEFIPGNVSGSQEDRECYQVISALCNYFGRKEAWDLIKEWASSRIDPKWNLEKKIEQNSNTKYQLGTFFYIAKEYGYTFPANPYKLKHKLFNLESATEKQSRLREKHHQPWLDSWKYTPTVVVESRFLNKYRMAELFEASDILCIKSSLGTGKTEILTHLAKKFPGGFIYITPRIALGIQTLERFRLAGITCYQLHEDDKEAFKFIPDKYSNLVVCPDSLWKFQDHDFDGKVVILDETIALVEHSLLSGTIAKKTGLQGRSNILHKGEQKLQRAAKLILLDGHQTDEYVDYIVKLRKEGNPNNKICKVLNTYSPPPLDIEWIVGVDEEGVKKTNDNSPIFNNILSILNSNRSELGDSPSAVALVTDSQSTAEAWDRAYTKLGKRVFRVDRKTKESNKEEVKRFLTNPDEFIRENDYELYTMSPTVVMGFDINIKNYFSKCFALFFGVIGTKAQLQFIGRIRHCKKWAIWCAEFNRGMFDYPYAYEEDKVKFHMASYLLNDAKLTFGDKENQDLLNHIKKCIAESVDDIHTNMAIKLTTRHNYERANSSHCLLDRLKRGNNITEVHVLRDDNVNKLVKGIKEEIKRENAIKRFESPDITIEEARDIRIKMNASEEEAYSADKAYLKQRLPGIEESDKWTVDFFEWYFEKGGSDEVLKIERFVTVTNLNLGEINNQASWHDRIQGQTYNERGELEIIHRNIFTLDIRTFFIKLVTMQKLGLLDLIGREAVTSDDDQIQSFIRKVRHHKQHQTNLKRVLGKSDEIQYVNSILDFIGVQIEKTRMSKKKGEPQKWQYSYKSPLENDLYKMLFTMIKKRCGDRAAKYVARISPLTLPGIPHYSEWLDKDEIENIESWMLSTYTETTSIEDREQGLEAIRNSLKIMWIEYPAKTEGLAQEAQKYIEAEPPPPF